MDIFCSCLTEGMLLLCSMCSIYWLTWSYCGLGVSTETLSTFGLPTTSFLDLVPPMSDGAFEDVAFLLAVDTPPPVL